MLAIGELFGLDREAGGQAAGDRMVPVAHGDVEIVAARMIGIRAGVGGNDDRIAGGVEGHAGAKARSEEGRDGTERVSPVRPRCATCLKKKKQNTKKTKT